MKTITGVEVVSMKDEQGNELFFPNPAKDESKMSMWNALFGEGPAKIMRANYLSHCKNGYKDSNGNKVRNIRDLEGNILREMELKDETEKSSTKVTQPAVSLADAVAVYKELVKMKNPALKTAIEMQMNIIKSLIHPVLLNADIDTLQFIIDLKKAETTETTEQKVA
jgi:hypothetical protein